MDTIKIENLHIYAYHGVLDDEKEKGQNFYINTELYTDTYSAGHSDLLDETVNYAAVCEFIAKEFTKEKYNLIETAANLLAEAILLKFSLVKGIKLEVKKPEAPINMDFGCVSVEIARQWHTVYLSVGSNMGDKQDYINKAIDALKTDEKIRVSKISSMIITKPYGGVEQDDFINGAIEIETIYSPLDLLSRLNEIEADCERVRKIHWGPRTLDLDIIFYDDLVINSERLTIPHVDMINRQFVLEPLCEIAPQFVHPTELMSVKNLLEKLNKN